MNFLKGLLGVEKEDPQSPVDPQSPPSTIAAVPTTTGLDFDEVKFQLKY